MDHGYAINKLPMSIPMKKRNPWYLNLNVYRNTHRQSLGKMKNMYTDLLVSMYPDLEPVYFSPPYRFTYTLYFPTNTRIDLMNYGSIVDKFVCDVLVNMGVIQDDDTSIIREVRFIDGGVKKGQRYANLLIEPANTTS